MPLFLDQVHTPEDSQLCTAVTSDMYHVYNNTSDSASRNRCPDTITDTSEISLGISCSCSGKTTLVQFSHDDPGTEHMFFGIGGQFDEDLCMHALSFPNKFTNRDLKATTKN